LEVACCVARRDDPGDPARDRSADGEMEGIVVRESAVAVVAALGTGEAEAHVADSDVVRRV
jgi:hypothetical protein